MEIGLAERPAAEIAGADRNDPGMSGDDRWQVSSGDGIVGEVRSLATRRSCKKIGHARGGDLHMMRP